MSREIPLTKGFITIVDDEDYDRLMTHSWCASTNPTTGITYAVRGVRTKLPDGRITTKAVYMHNEIMGKKEGLHVDHISRDSLDNRKLNFRWATRSQNCMNTSRAVGKTGFMGVYGREGGYQAMIDINGRGTNLGFFKDKVKAAKAYNEAAARLRGEFARLNVIPDQQSTG